MTLSIFDAARDEPERIAVIAGSLELSFRELSHRVQQRLHELRAAGALDPKGERPVSVIARPTLDTVETLLALFAAGTPALLLHARAGETERESLCARANAVAAPPPVAAPPDSSVAREPHAAPKRREFPNAPRADFDPERIAALVATSGSTGEPRLARLSHRAFLANARAMGAHYGVKDDRWLLALPFAHIGGLGMLARCVVHRCTLILFEPKRSMLAELDALASAAERHQATLISLVPTLLSRLLEPPLAWRPTSELRAVVLGGAPIPRDLVRRARSSGIPVVPTYGMTETCASAVSGRFSERLTLPREEGELLPSGIPLEGVEVRLVNGVIEARGDMLFSGYLGEPAHEQRDWLTTHDRGSFDEQGELTVTGRTSDVIITAGENVDPAEVEAALLALPGVRLACVLGVPDATYGELVTALLVVTAEGPRTSAAVAERLNGRLSRYKFPRRVELVAELPLTPAGKIDRRATRSLYELKS